MFFNNLLNTIKNKTSSRSSSKGSESKSQRNSASPQLYEEVKLNKSNFGAPASNQQNDNDIMSEFVIVDFKEYAPYTVEEWKAILSHSDLITVDNQRLYVSLRKGIPKKLRKRIWLYLSHAEELKQENAKKGITYEWLLTQECPDKHNITKDITRTFPELEFFNEHTEERLKHLENILSAYAVFDPEVGYTQGINFLVATLIYYMYAENEGRDEPLNDMEFESEIFWILVHIIQTKNWRGLYIDETPKLIELINRLEHRISSELPKLYDLFQEHLLIPACFSQCFLTLLFYNSPMKFSKRVLDMFLLVGEDIILELVMKMLTLCEKDILEKTEIEELYPFLRSKLTQFTFEKYEKEFSNLVDEQNVISIIEYD